MTTNTTTDDVVTTRIPAWRTVGHMVQTRNGKGMSSATAMKKAGLAGWNVRKEPITTASGIVVPNRMATVRDNGEGGTSYLGVVGNNYAVHQNEEMFDFLDTLVDVSGAHYDTAGQLRDGAKVFVSMKMPEGINIAGQDAHDLYLLAQNGHDGGTAFTVAVVPIRLACTNQLTAAFRGARQRWSIRHTANMAGKITEARESLDLTFAYMDKFNREMERLLDREYTEAQFDKLTRGLFPDAKSDGRQTRQDEKRETAMRLFLDAPTNEFGRGTRYAAYNAVAEYADWYATGRGADPDGVKRATRTLNAASERVGSVQGMKDYAFKVLQRA